MSHSNGNETRPGIGNSMQTSSLSAVRIEMPDQSFQPPGYLRSDSLETEYLPSAGLEMEYFPPPPYAAQDAAPAYNPFWGFQLTREPTTTTIARHDFLQWSHGSCRAVHVSRG